MKLEDYERPNTLRGIHSGPGTSQAFDHQWWVNLLKSMHMGWIKVLDDGSGSMMGFAKLCRQNGIMPIVRLWRAQPNPGNLPPSHLGIVQRYVSEGITKWFEPNNEPNLPDEWKDKNMPLLDIAARTAARHWIQDAEAIIQAGGYPAIPALAQCSDHGECSSLRFYVAFFNWLADNANERMANAIDSGAWLAVHDAVLNHVWVEDNVYHFEYPKNHGLTPCQDDNSLIGHECPRDHIYDRWHRRLPIISTEGGVFHLVGKQYDPRYPKMDSSETHAGWTLEMLKWLDEYEKTHPWFFGICPWLLASSMMGHPSQWEGEAWVQQGRQLPVTQYLRDNPPRKLDGPAPEPSGPTGPSPPPAEIEYVGLSQQMIDMLRVDPPPNRNLAYWKVVKVEVQPHTYNFSAFAVANARQAMFSWADGGMRADFKSDSLAPVGARENAASMPMFAVWGSYNVAILDNDGNSETLRGFGLYADDLSIDRTAHHPVLVYFTLVEGGTPEPSGPTGPDITPPAIYVKPPDDNGLGIHLGVDDMSEASIHQQITWMKEMRLKWATVAAGSREVMVRVAGQLWAEGIMPVCRWVGTIANQHDFKADALALMQNGIPPYVQIFNEPSDEREWDGAKPTDYVQRWAGLWAQKASEVAAAGGFPGLQCLHPNELDAVLAILPKTDPVWKRAWFCSHNYGLNHPPAWHEDHWCILGCQDFAKVFQEKLGFVPPVICGEGGWIYGASEDPRYPKVELALHAQYTKQMFESFRTGVLCDGSALPDHLFAVCPWILSGRSMEPWYGWVTKTQTIEAVKSIPVFVRGEAMQPYSFVEGAKRLLGADKFVDMRVDVEQWRKDILGSNYAPLQSRSFSDIRYIVIHHTGSNYAHQTAKSVAEYDIRKWGNASYHFHVGWPEGKNEDVVYFISPLKAVTSHAANFNTPSIGISVMGDYTSRDPTAKQIKTLRLLLLALWEFFGAGWDRNLRYPFMMPHGKIYGQQTACPGRIERALTWGSDWPTRP